MTGSSYLLVPGAGGAAGFWHLVVDDLERRGHRATAVDLPAEDEAAGLPEYVETIVAAAGDGEDIVLVGQSMGAFSASMAVPFLPVSRLILLNPMIPAPGETPGEWWANTGQREARRANDIREGRDPDAEFDVFTMFLHDLSPAELELSAALARDESDAAFATPWTLTAWPDVPTHVISGRDDRCFPADFQRRVSEERLGITPDVIPGGHLAALSQTSALVDRMLAYR